MASGDTIRLEHMPENIQVNESGADLIPANIPDFGLDIETILATAEKTLLQKALEKAGGVKTEAARLLGLTFRSFRHRLQKYGMN
jgi:two-component system response regulator PilR (NtrC family)